MLMILHCTTQFTVSFQPTEYTIWFFSLLIFLVPNLDLDIWSTPALILTSHRGSLWISPQTFIFLQTLVSHGSPNTPLFLKCPFLLSKLGRQGSQKGSKTFLMSHLDFCNFIFFFRNLHSNPFGFLATGNCWIFWQNYNFVTFASMFLNNVKLNWSCDHLHQENQMDLTL